MTIIVLKVLVFKLKLLLGWLGSVVEQGGVVTALIGLQDRTVAILHFHWCALKCCRAIVDLGDSHVGEAMCQTHLAGPISPVDVIAACMGEVYGEAYRNLSTQANSKHYCITVYCTQPFYKGQDFWTRLNFSLSHGLPESLTVCAVPCQHSQVKEDVGRLGARHGEGGLGRVDLGTALSVSCGGRGGKG